MFQFSALVSYLAVLFDFVSVSTTSAAGKGSIRFTDSWKYKSNLPAFIFAKEDRYFGAKCVDGTYDRSEEAVAMVMRIASKLTIQVSVTSTP